MQFNRLYMGAQRAYNPSEAREPPAGTRFKAGRRPAAEASNNNNNRFFLSYMNFPSRGFPRAMRICVLTILGLLRWKMTSIFSKMEDNLNILAKGR